LLSCAGLWAAAAPFALRFGASGGLAIPLEGAAADVLLIGERADALPGYDSNDVPAPPAPPGEGVPLLFFATGEPLTSQCWHDFRPLGVGQTWELHLEGMASGTTVTLTWRLDSGSLGANSLQLVDRQTRAVLVPDLLATNSIAFQDHDRTLLVTYGDGNLLPSPRYDATFMLETDSFASLPFAALLGNDDDPDAGDLLSVVAVGSPALPGGATPAPGSTTYGTTALDAANARLTYALPTPLPADWTGQVAFGYSARDSSPFGPGESQGTVRLTVAPHLVQDPLAARVLAPAGSVVELSYTLRHTGALQSLAIEYALPLFGSGAGLGSWQFQGEYGDDAAGTAAPLIEAGYGPDGIPGTADDTGTVRLDFGTAVPPTGTRLHFRVRLPTTASGEARVTSRARYCLGSAPTAEPSQVLADVVVKVPTYTVAFTAGTGGTLSGTAAQAVDYGGNSTAVLAVAAPGYAFVRWSDGVTTNPRRFTNVQADARVTAEFVLILPVEPSGHFDLGFRNAANPPGRELWDFTGHYNAPLGAYTLQMDLVHDERGALTGTGTVSGSLPGGSPVSVPVTLRGRASGQGGVVTVAIRLSGMNATSSATAKLILTREASGLVGAYAVSLGLASGGNDSVSGTCALALPAGMDGSFRLGVDLVQHDRAMVTGSGRLTLSNGRAVDLLIRGRSAGGTTLLHVEGDGTIDPLFGALQLALQITTFSNHAADITTLSGKAFGQRVNWP
jgi:hypothetical protein